MNFKDELLKLDITASDAEIFKFNTYYEFLVDYNNKVNLTAITEYDDVLIKHFYDSLTLTKALDKNITLCDVGAGAGFPSVPSAIIRDDIDVTIIDSLNKRITFLNELIKKLDLKNVKAIHSRAEDFAKTKREYFDVVTARAVARLNVLAELCMPLVRVGGTFLAMKSLDSSEEIDEAKKAIEILGGKIEGTLSFDLPYEYGKREIIIIKKVKNTPLKYPRQFSVIKNKAL